MDISDYQDIEDTIDMVLEMFQHNPEYLPYMVENVCSKFPELDVDEVEEGLMIRLSAATEEIISKTDLFDAHLMGDINSSTDYLKEIYPKLSRNEIKKQLKSAIESNYSPSKPESSERKMDEITRYDVNEALEFYGFAFGPDLREKMIKYMCRKYPTLDESEIIRQLTEYDFGDKIVTPQKSRTPRGAESPSSWSPRMTLPPLGSTYQPSDFSPSSYGAASVGAMDFYKTERSKHLPDYTSPSTPRGKKRFLEDLPPPPRTPPSLRRRLSFGKSRSFDPNF